MGLSITGENNRLIIVENGKERELTEEIPGLDIVVNGNDNLVRIGFPQDFQNSRLEMFGNGNCFEKQRSGAKTSGVFFHLNHGSRIIIGRNCLFNGNISILAKEKKGVSVILGDNVIMGTGCIIRTGDGHTIVDKGSRDPLNEPQDVVIDRHVWIGAHCMLLKGTKIRADSVVGAMSLVNRKFEEKNLLIAGVPARVIREGIDWDICDYISYTEVDETPSPKRETLFSSIFKK